MNFNSLLREKKAINDFDEVNQESCVYVKHTVKNGEPYTVCGIWQPIIELDSLLAKSRTLELSLSGIDKVITPPEVIPSKVYKGTEADPEYINSLELNVSSVINGYVKWKLHRERFLTGRAGSLYDFDELMPLIGDLTTLEVCTSYNDFYKLVYNMLKSYTTSNDTLNAYLDLKEYNLRNLSKELSVIETNPEDEKLYKLISGQGALSNLKRNSSFTKYELSFILVKILEMCEIERSIEALKTEYLEKDTGINERK